MSYDGDTDTQPPFTERDSEYSTRQLSLDEIHGILGHERRRSALSYLTNCPDATVSVDELVDAVAEREQPDPGPATHRVRIETDLHHVHLPKLADTNVIEYDPAAKSVRYTASERLEALLEASIELEEDRDERR